MKKLFLALALLISVAGNSQVTLEHTYPAQEQGILVYNLENVGHRYMTQDQINKKVNLYDVNHNLWKSIDAKIPAGHDMRHAIFPSTKLFDLDAGVEVLVFYSINSPQKNYAQIVDETGTVLNVIPYAIDAYVQLFDTSWKLVVHMMDVNPPPPLTIVQSWSEVYSLPGQFAAIKGPNTNTNSPSSMLYPNPMGDVATLEYTLPKGEQKGTVQIYNTNGTVIRTYPINQNTGTLMIQRDGLPAGAYYITTSSDGVQSTAQKIIMN